MLKESIVENQIEVVTNLPISINRSSSYVIDQPNPNYVTHGYFKYPCKFIPEIPRWAIKKYLGNEGGKVFDPFAGSGTTLLEGILSNCDSYGTEIDEIAKLVIRAKTTPLNKEEISETEEIVQEISERMEVFTTETRFFVPEINNLSHWFTDENTKKLGIIGYYIETEISNQKIKDFLSVCFISIIRAVSNADNVSPKPYVSKKVIKKPADPLYEFNKVYKNYIQGMIELNSYCIKKAAIIKGDALEVKDPIEVDLIITSPPYINAFDYARTLRLENLWLGLETEETLREKKQSYIGTETIDMKEEKEKLDILTESKRIKDYYNQISKIDAKRALIVKKFFDDMKTNLVEMKKLLPKDGVYCIVIGNNKIRNVEIENWRVLSELAQNVGYEVELSFSYLIQNPYLRIPRKGRGGQIKKDYVLVLRNKS